MQACKYKGQEFRMELEHIPLGERELRKDSGPAVAAATPHARSIKARLSNIALLELQFFSMTLCIQLLWRVSPPICMDLSARTGPGFW